MFVVRVDFEIRKGCLQEFREAVLKQARVSLELEENCHTFHVCSSEAPEQDHRFFLYEEYTDRAAFEEHLQSDHFRAFDSRVKPWLSSKQVSTWSRL